MFNELTVEEIDNEWEVPAAPPRSPEGPRFPLHALPSERPTRSGARLMDGRWQAAARTAR